MISRYDQHKLFHVSLVGPVASGGILDFSHTDADVLDENDLDETGPDVFVSALPASDLRAMAWFCEGSYDVAFPVFPDGQDLDWNCDGVLDLGISSRLNGDAALSLLETTDDWQELREDSYCASQPDWGDDSVASGPDAIASYALATVDLMPECAANAVPLDDDTPIRLVFYGDGTWAPSDLRRQGVRLAGAPPRGGTLADVDSDGHTDLVATFYASDMKRLRSMSTTALFNARTKDGVVYVAKPAVSPGTYTDGDDDGVLDPCDACPSTPPGTAVGWDGCP